MKCPIDNTTLQLTAREGIEIDYCPECRGVWLDRGELDKIIDRTISMTAQSQPTTSMSGTREQDRTIPLEGGQHAYYRDDEDDDDDHDHHDSRGSNPYDARGQQPKKRKKESFLGDLFDF